MPRLFVSCVVLLLLCAQAMAEDKYLYLIRHGDSVWNNANFVKKGWDVVKSAISNTFQSDHWAHKARYTDAPLSPKGIMDALSLCVAIYGDQGNCLAMIQDLKTMKVAYTPEASNALDKRADADGRTHGHIMANRAAHNEEEDQDEGHGREVGGTVAHYISNLVRAMDTMFFALHPSITTNEIPRVVTTSYLQEIGKGWDGSMHQTRSACSDPNKRLCSKLRHPRQEYKFGHLKELDSFSNAFSDIFNKGDPAGEHLEYYNSLTVFPNNDKDYFQFQKIVTGDYRASEAVYTEMFQQFLNHIARIVDKYVVIAGHSHYFGHMVAHLGAENPRCLAFGEAMQHNGAVWRVKVTSTEVDRKWVHVISDCHIVYGQFKTRSDAVDQYRKEDIPGRDMEQMLEELISDLKQFGYSD